MAFDSAFLALMPLTVTVEKALVGQYDVAGKPKMSGDITSYRARKQLKNVRFTNITGKEITSTMQVYLACTDKLSPEDKLTVPDVDLKDKPIQEIRLVDDEEGPHHTVAYF
jgi:hypothetical protein